MVLKTQSVQTRRFFWCGSWGYSTINLSTKFLSYYVRVRHLSTMMGMWMSVDALWPGERHLWVRGEQGDGRSESEGERYGCNWALNTWGGGNKDHTCAVNNLTYAMITCLSLRHMKCVGKL